MTKASKEKKLLDGINLGLIREQAAYAIKEDSPEADKYRNAQAGLLEAVRAVGQTGDPVLILVVEKTILVNEKRNYGNSPGMIRSLDEAIQDMTATEKLIAIVQDPVAYKAIDTSHNRPRSRVRGVPRDEARKSLSSHLTRLLNMDKSRLTETEKQTVGARRNNLRTAEKAYVVLQHAALGMDPEKSKERGRGRER